MMEPTPIADIRGPVIPCSPSSVARAGMPIVTKPADRPIAAPSRASSRMAGDLSSPLSLCPFGSGIHARE
jgi:hypothetical protein